MFKYAALLLGSIVALAFVVFESVKLWCVYEAATHLLAAL